MYDNVRQGLDAFPWDPLFTGGVCLGPGPKDNVTGVLLLDAHHHHGPPRDPGVHMSGVPLFSCLHLLLEIIPWDPHVTCSGRFYLAIVNSLSNSFIKSNHFAKYGLHQKENIYQDIESLPSLFGIH